MDYKIIVAGRLEFGNAKTFGKVLEMYQFRVDNFYKFDLLFKEDVFDHEQFHLNIPRLVKQSDLKSWDNTLKLIEYLAEFAVAGSVRFWKISEKGGTKKIEHIQIEPEADKAAVQSFLKGKKLIEEEGKETEAITALNKAIEKYERHALAYERRGLVNFKFKNYKDALYDFSKSIDLNPNNPEPYYGRALVNLTIDNNEAAIVDLGLTVKHSIPLQRIHNKARKMKSEMLINAGKSEKAENDLRFLALRNYDPEDPIKKHQRNLLFLYGQVLMKVEKYQEAVVIFEKSIQTEPGPEKIEKAELLVNYGVALQKAGKKGFKKNWKSAAELGSTQAKELLLAHKK